MRARDIIRDIDVHPSRLAEIRPRDLLVRFGFGAAISILAGAIGTYIDTSLGGMFLAFPAILPATITLIADKEDRAGAQQNVEGAIAGGIGLVAFAVTAYVALAGLHWSSSLALALAAWIATSISSYVILELTAFGHGSSSDGGSGPTDP